jgi:hypothetical protein
MNILTSINGKYKSPTKLLISQQHKYDIYDKIRIIKIQSHKITS